GDSAPPSGDSTVDAGSSSGDLPRTPDLGPTSGIVINHNHVALFEQIPAQYLAAARNIKMVFSDRSVGQNIHESLDCLTAASYGQTPVSCRRDWVAGGFTQIKNYTQSDYNANQVPAHMRFTPDPVRYDRSNWKFEARTGSWSELTGNFITQLAPQYINQGYQVLSYQFSYLNVDPQSDIASPSQGFFVANASKYDIKDLEAFWAQHPTKTFVLWTASLARGIGSAASRDFNQQMRQYATQHNMILFDMADITSHTPSGAPCFDNRDGVQYCSPTNSSSCENHPDDGVAYPAICRDYTTELDGGHLGSVGGARVRIAKAMWVLMARIAGWTPN
ncbi:MAG: hypothetical protein KC503_39780, partial [Myxococcales bacterium]|nr:hypothetical protein [Myxococcales bacterium]